MTQEHHAEGAGTAEYHGEVWTDGRGYATVELPVDAALLPPLEYELQDLEPSSSARITAELEHGRFTIATAQPHVKVAWRVKARLAATGTDNAYAELPPDGTRSEKRRI